MQNIQKDQRHVCKHTCQSSQNKKKIPNYKLKGSFFNLVFQHNYKICNSSYRDINLYTLKCYICLWLQ